MKKVFCLVIAMLLMATGAYAKNLSPGTIALTGSTSLQYLSQTQDFKGLGEFDATQWSLLLNGEYYFMDNIGIGLIFDYEKQDVDTPLGNVETDSLLIGPQAVYNISVNEMASIPVFGAIGYASTDLGDGEDLTGWGWLLGTGVRYFLMDSVSLDGYLAYDQIYLDDGGSELDVDEWRVLLGFSVYLGGM